MFKSLRLALAAIGVAGQLAAVAVLAQALWSFHSLDRAASQALVAKDVVADILPPPMYLVEYRLVLSRAVEGSMSLPVATREADRLEAEYRARETYWRANPPLGLERSLLGPQHETALKLMEAGRTAIFAQLEGGDVAGARAGLQQIEALYSEHRKHVDDTVVLSSGVATSSMQVFATTQTKGLWTMVIVTLVLLLCTLACYLLARRSIMQPVTECVELAQAVAGGDLTRTAPTRRKDELGLLQDSLGAMCGQLRQMVGQVRGGVGAIANAANEIAAGNDDLSTRTQQQASALEETSATMEEMTATIKRSADHSSAAARLSAETERSAEQGNAVILDTIEAMKDITTSSRKITNIIEVIDSIAFQTNLLALNAAVEAARAGEQGRGFAVVAAEVRTLSQRSATAAKEIKELIEESVSKVDAGSELVNVSGAKLAAIMNSIRSVNETIAEIALSGREQAKGIDQVNIAVEEIDHATQQNAALVEQMASASKLMNDQAADLARLMQYFRTDEDGVWSGKTMRSRGGAQPPGGSLGGVTAGLEPLPFASGM